MQAVPSLVGTGTAVAAAATGLVFGQQPITPAAPSILECSPARTLRRSHKRTISVDRDLEPDYRSVSHFQYRPATTSASPSIGDEYAHYRAASHSQVSRPPLSRYQRPQSSQITSSRPFHRRLSFARQGEAPIAPQSNPRDSGSSNGSWIRRFSMRPQSQQDSPRSSLIADTTSVDHSDRSAALVSHRPCTAATPLPPNKLVKRSSATPTRGGAAEGSPRRRPAGHLPTFRRPATSHQRSATLQQFRAEIDVAGSIIHPKYSVEQPIWPEELLGAPPFHEQLPPVPPADPGWVSYFHSQTAIIPQSSSLQNRVGDASSSSRTSPSKRIYPGGSVWRGSAHLMKPRMIAHFFTSGDISPAPAMIEELSDRSVSPGNVPPTRARRSLSASLSSASSWVSRRSGSLRRQKRVPDNSGSVTKRQLSEPAEPYPSHLLADSQEDNRLANQSDHISLVPKPLPETSRVDASVATHHQHASHQRHASSPLSNFTVITYGGGDVSRANGFCRVSGSARQPRPNQPSGSSTSSAAMSQLGRASNHDRMSVMESSDGDARGFTSGDDDDFDFKSDIVFDSMRTHSSCRAKAVETPLESVYDESPPSTAGNGRTKRLSAQELLGRGWDEDNRIMEEDESMPSPSRVVSEVSNFREQDTATCTKSTSFQDDATGQLAMAIHGCTLDDTLDEDEDWTKDEGETLTNNGLSPFLKAESPVARGVNPNIRVALVGLDEEGAGSTSSRARPLERPMSNLFEWSEPAAHDKQDCIGTNLRPKTSYAMPEMDSRGGRSAIRRGPAPMHVRSQSVPVVHELLNSPKPPGPKYGTWGMATKTVSEDWDEDFDFEAGAEGGDGNTTDKSQEKAFAVPESIRATQPSVRAHSGQIRELSLLVNDLKRLCRHGRELGMLDGEQMALWKEAEGIIALASPDEDDGNQETSSSSPIDLAAFDAKLLPRESRFDTPTSESLSAAEVDTPEPAMRKTAVVRERQSPRRRSVFSPDDDIFGGSWTPGENGTPPPGRNHQPRTPDGRGRPSGDVNGAVKSVMDSMRQNPRTSMDSAREPRSKEPSGRVHFDTNSLKALVKRAGELRDALSDMVRRADQITQSPAATPKRERRLESSPAFTRVFDDPGSSPPRRTIKSRGNNSLRESANSTDRPPSSPMSSQMPLMTVN